MWSTGCIFVELFTKKVLFKGVKIFDQMKQIVKITGLPTHKTYQGLESYQNIAPRLNQLRQHIEKDIKNFGCYVQEDTKDKDGSDLVIDLICWMLELDPDERPKPHEALNSALFRKYAEIVKHYPNDENPRPFICPCVEDTLEYYKAKITEEIFREIN